MATVIGEVTSCLHLNTQVGPATGLSKGVTYYNVAGHYISTTLAGECMMARGSSILPGHRGQIEPHEVSRPSHHLMATWNSEGWR